jgi:hypothetical protein
VLAAICRVSSKILAATCAGRSPLAKQQVDGHPTLRPAASPFRIQSHVLGWQKVALCHEDAENLASPFHPPRSPTCAVSTVRFEAVRPSPQDAAVPYSRVWHEFRHIVPQPSLRSSHSSGNTWSQIVIGSATPRPSLRACCTRGLEETPMLSQADYPSALKEVRALS